MKAKREREAELLGFCKKKKKYFAMLVKPIELYRGDREHCRHL
jgi:hypothetical protein